MHTTETKSSSEHTPTTPTEKALQRIEHFTKEELLQLQKELQFALKFWSQAYSQAQSHILWADRAAHHKDIAYHAYLHGRENIAALLKSPLYEAIRAASGLPKNWAGWLEATQEDVNAINEAIHVIVSSMMPVRESVSKEDLIDAKMALTNKYGIKMFFVDDPTEAGIIDTFNKRWNANTTQEILNKVTDKAQNLRLKLQKKFVK